MALFQGRYSDREAAPKSAMLHVSFTTQEGVVYRVSVWLWASDPARSRLWVDDAALPAAGAQEAAGAPGAPEAWQELVLFFTGTTACS